MGNFISLEDFKNQALTGQTKSGINTLAAASNPIKAQAAPDTVELKGASNSKDELRADLTYAKRQNGLIEKIADKIKSALNFGANSKQIQSAIDNNSASDEEIDAQITKYRASQENTAQAVGDSASAAASIFGFFKAKEAIQIKLAQTYHMNGEKFLDAAKDFEKSLPKKLQNKDITGKIQNIAKGKALPIVAAVIPAMIIGGIVKKYLLKINRIGTSQYKAEITPDMDKQEIKKAKKIAAKNKANANSRNGWSGAINGLLTPLLTLSGAIGVPLYLAANSLNRYFIGTREDRKEKSFKSYVQNLKASPVVHAASAAAIALPAIKQQKADKVFNKNIEEVTEKLKQSYLTSQASSKSSYQQLEDIIFADEKIKAIIDGNIPGYDLSELYSMSEKDKLKLQIEALSKENILAIKFKQIAGGSDALTSALKEKCPSTYTLEEAQAKINEAFGGKYTVVSSFGAGTVAETYLVKDASGKEFCVKMLKKGINAEKIEADTQAFVDIIQNLQGKTQDEKDFLIKNLKNIAQGVLEEVDFQNEMKAAGELAKVTRQARVVKPVEVSNNIYVMEKANGISLESLIKYVSDKDAADQLEKLEKDVEKLKAEGEDGFWLNWKIEELEKARASAKEIEALRSELGDITKEEAKTLLLQYQNVLVEQFNQVGKGGKTIHGDIHPGNIYIDLKTLRSGKKDFFTLIDTGNTIRQSSESALRFLNLSKYTQNADFENIADFVLEGAKLPEGMSLEKAKEVICEELKKAFFDYETYIGPVSADTILGITDSAMQKLGIIPGGIQAGLIKSKTSASRSMEEFGDTFRKAIGKKLMAQMKERGIDLDNFDPETKLSKKDTFGVMKDASLALGDMGITAGKYPLKQAIQERKNLALLSPAEKIKMKKSASTPAKNSKEYLTYVIKQHKKEVKLADLFDGLDKLTDKEVIDKLKSMDLALLKRLDNSGAIYEIVEELQKDKTNFSDKEIEQAADQIRELTRYLRLFSMF